jgi:hypothetical protein
MKIKHLQLPGTVKIMMKGSINFQIVPRIKNINNKANPMQMSVRTTFNKSLAHLKSVVRCHQKL